MVALVRWPLSARKRASSCHLTRGSMVVAPRHQTPDRWHAEVPFWRVHLAVDPGILSARYGASPNGTSGIVGERLSCVEEVDDLLLTAVLGPASCRRVELEVDDRRVGSPRQEVAHQLYVPVAGGRVEGGAAGTAHQGAAVVEGVDVEPDVEHEADGVAAPELGCPGERRVMVFGLADQLVGAKRLDLGPVAPHAGGDELLDGIELSWLDAAGDEQFGDLSVAGCFGALIERPFVVGSVVRPAVGIDAVVEQEADAVDEAAPHGPLQVQQEGVGDR